MCTFISTDGIEYSSLLAFDYMMEFYMSVLLYRSMFKSNDSVCGVVIYVVNLVTSLMVDLVCMDG
jgi:hypothetical protein